MTKIVDIYKNECMHLNSPYKSIRYLPSSLLLYLRHRKIMVMVTEIIESPHCAKGWGAGVQSPLSTAQKPK